MPLFKERGSWADAGLSLGCRNLLPITDFAAGVLFPFHELQNAPYLLGDTLFVCYA